MGGTKFMQVLDDDVYDLLARIGRQYGISVQELLRAQTVPDWLDANRATEQFMQFPQIRKLLLKEQAKLRVKLASRPLAKSKRLSGSRKGSRSRFLSSR